MINNRFIKLFSLTLCLLTFISCRTSEAITSSTILSPVSESQDEKASIFKKLQENDHLTIEDRIALYYKLKNEHSLEYNFEDEQELNRYGYSLLSKDKVKEAIEIFKLLVSEFPNSANPYDSLGEAYLADGNEELALINYEKTVELNPQNNYAVDQITQLKGLEILVTDWGKEFFHFPLHFAPEIPYIGVEEVVFPENWIKPDSTDFWSYVFVWALNDKKSITPGELEVVLKQYFDGLMAVVNDDKDAKMIKTSAHFEMNNDSKSDMDIIGNLTIFDAFATNKPLNLNARIFSNYCEERGKLILHFQFSPQAFDHAIWDKLRTVLIRSTICEK